MLGLVWFNDTITELIHGRFDTYELMSEPEVGLLCFLPS
jgi:hypothetical protein